MTVYMFPATLVPSNSSFELVSNTRSFKSPLTNAVQTLSRKGSLWKVSMKFNNLSGDNRIEMQAFLAKLKGQEHRFYLQDHSAYKRGIAPTNPLDSVTTGVAGQTGPILLAAGVSGVSVNYFRAGDQIAFNNELHLITEDVSKKADGTFEFDKPNNDLTTTLTAGIPIAPNIRKPTNLNDAIDYAHPVYGVFILTSSASWDTAPGIISNFTVEGVEDVLA
jgi:hypothetical protein|tara:strand:+ start:286 stop:945 length:660 start_codon:yes stop_codon:yes gene_type:complete